MVRAGSQRQPRALARVAPGWQKALRLSRQRVDCGRGSRRRAIPQEAWERGLERHPCTAVLYASGLTVATAGFEGMVRVYGLDLHQTIQLARSRVTRGLTGAECRRYLHFERCPGGGSAQPAP